MRCSPIILLLVLITSALTSFGQNSGQGYTFSYDGAGYRIQREYHTVPISYTKPGNRQEEIPIDTLVGAFQEENAIDSKQTIIVKAYPNPTRTNLYVENYSWKHGSNAAIMIFDIAGKKIMEESVLTPKKQIDLRSLAPGTYQVNYQTAKGKMFTWKIVKL